MHPYVTITHAYAHTHIHSQPHVNINTNSQLFLSVFLHIFLFPIYSIFLTAWWLLFCKKTAWNTGSQSIFHELNIYIYIYIYMCILRVLVAMHPYVTITHTCIRTHPHTPTHLQPYVNIHTNSQWFLSVFFWFLIYSIFLTAWWLLFCKKLHETQGHSLYSMNIYISNIYLFIIIYIKHAHINISTARMCVYPVPNFH